MQPSTFEALMILVVAFVPGAAYVWAFERQAGPYGVTLADRMMRFLAASIVAHDFWISSNSRREPMKRDVTPIKTYGGYRGSALPNPLPKPPKGPGPGASSKPKPKPA